MTVNIVIYDENAKAGDNLRDIVLQSAPADSVYTFNMCEALRDFAGKEHIDVAFINVDDRKGKGIFLAGRLKKLQPRINFIFISEDIIYDRMAFEIRVSGYIMSTPTFENVSDELSNLRYR